MKSLVSINLCCYDTKRLPWVNYQLWKVMKYSNKKKIRMELLICSEIDPKLFEHFPKHKFIPCREGELIGVKRNLLLEASRGEYICVFDDDDWYPHYRIKLCLELMEMLPPDVDLITTNRLFCYNIAQGRSYYVTCESESALFFKRKIYYEEDRTFGTQQIGEGLALAKGKRIYFENDHVMIIALQHSSNTSEKNTDMNLGKIDDILDPHEMELLETLIEN